MGSPDAPDPYALLGVAPGATTAEIRLAFRLAARRAHPDTGGDPARFVALREAFDLLVDPVRRARHDAGARSGVAAGPTRATDGRPGPAAPGSVSGGEAADGEGLDTPLSAEAAAIRSRWGALERAWSAAGRLLAAAAGNDLVLVAEPDGPAVGAIDARSGERRWDAGLVAAVVGSPVMVGDLTVVVTADGVAHGIEVATGRTRWERRPAGGARDAVAAGDGAVVVGADALTAIDPDGVVRWAVRPAGGVARVVSAGPVVAVHTGSGVVAGVDPRTGATRWWVRQSPVWEPLPVVVGPWLWLPTGQPGELVAIDPRSGVAGHRVNLPDPLVGLHDVAGLLVARGGDRSITAVRSARPQWRMIVPSAPSAPQLSDGCVVIVSADATLRFLSRRHGTELHRLDVPVVDGRVFGATPQLLVTGDIVLVGDDDGCTALRRFTPAGGRAPR